MSATIIVIDANVTRQGAAEYETTIRMTDTSKSGWANTIRGMPRVGDMAERRRTTKMQDIEAFSEMTGDRNPIHYDRELAESTVFGKLIVQGGVTSGILGLCGHYCTNTR
jgi:acyl dehydratase